MSRVWFTLFGVTDYLPVLTILLLMDRGGWWVEVLLVAAGSRLVGVLHDGGEAGGWAGTSAGAGAVFWLSSRLV